MILPIRLNTVKNNVTFKSSRFSYYPHFNNEPNEDTFAARTFQRLSSSFNINNAAVKREYIENTITNDYSYNFSISKNGKSLVDISRDFKHIAPNTTQTTINDKKYTAEYFDETKTVSITMPDGKVQDVDLGKKINKSSSIIWFLEPETGLDLSPEKTEFMWHASKNLPADLILDIDKYADSWCYCNDINSFTFTKKNFMATGGEMAFILHEIGHFKDSEKNLSNDNNLQAIYQKELELFNQRYKSKKVKNEISYYTKDSGIEELIADTNVIAATYDFKNKKVQKRTQRLISNFPMTISYIINR